MGELTQSQIVRAHAEVNRMTPAQKVALADEIFVHQPNLLASVLVLPRMGVGMVELEVPLHILFVTYQAMTLSGRSWPVITEHIQDGCMQRLTARMRFNDGLPAEVAGKIVQEFCDRHAERELLAFIYGHLGQHGLLKVRTDADKSVVLCAMNLAECVGFVGGTPQPLP